MEYRIKSISTYDAHINLGQESKVTDKQPAALHDATNLVSNDQMLYLMYTTDTLSRMCPVTPLPLPAASVISCSSTMLA